MSTSRNKFRFWLRLFRVRVARRSGGHKVARRDGPTPSVRRAVADQAIDAEVEHGTYNAPGPPGGTLWIPPWLWFRISSVARVALDRARCPLAVLASAGRLSTLELSRSHLARRWRESSHPFAPLKMAKYSCRPSPEQRACTRHPRPPGNGRGTQPRCRPCAG